MYVLILCNVAGLIPAAWATNCHSLMAAADGATMVTVANIFFSNTS
jgi:hypothetical protein